MTLRVSKDGYSTQQIALTDGPANGLLSQANAPWKLLLAQVRSLWERLEERTIERKFVSVEANRSPRLPQRVKHVPFAGHEIECAGLRVIGQDEIEERTVFGLRFRFGHLRYRLGVIFLQTGVENSGDQHAGTAATRPQQQATAGPEQLSVCFSSPVSCTFRELRRRALDCHERPTNANARRRHA
jgi:hypothetical protein